MSELLREQMSAFVDDALPGEETSLLLHRLESDAALTRAFACYQLIGASMRGEPDASALAERVRAVIRGEAIAPSGRSQTWRRMLKPVVGMVTAASVAIVAIMVVRGMGGGEIQPSATTVAAPGAPANAEPVAYTVAPRGAADGSGEAAGKARLATYVMRHGNYAIMPNSPVMNYRSVGVAQHSPVADAAEQTPADEVEPEPQAR